MFCKLQVLRISYIVYSQKHCALSPATHHSPRYRFNISAKLRYLVLAGHVKTNGGVVEYWQFSLKTIFAEYTIYIEVWKNSSLKNAYVEAGSCGCGHLGEVNLLWDGSLGRSGEVEPDCLELERGRRFRLLALNGKKAQTSKKVVVLSRTDYSIEDPCLP